MKKELSVSKNTKILCKFCNENKPKFDFPIQNTVNWCYACLDTYNFKYED